MKRFLFVLLLISVGSSDAQNRGAIIESTLAQSADSLKYHALVIGINAYQAETGWSPLAYPESDTNRLVKLLNSSYRFDQVTYLRGQKATKNKILSTLNRLQRLLGPSDALLIFYAGHGQTITEGSNRGGYWVPTDGTANPKSWVSLEALHSFMQGSRARHVLLMSDSCYAGSFFTRGKLENAMAPSEAGIYRRQIAKPSRYIITSGDMEAVPDKSSFAEHFISILEQTANPFVFSAEYVYHQLRNPVFRETGTQVLAKEMFLGGAGGNFIFIQRKPVQHESLLILEVEPPEAKVSVSESLDHVQAITLNEDDIRIAEHRIRLKPGKAISISLENHGFISKSFDWLGKGMQRKSKRVRLKAWRPKSLVVSNSEQRTDYLVQAIAPRVQLSSLIETKGWTKDTMTAATRSPSKKYEAIANYRRESYRNQRSRHARVYTSSVFVSGFGTEVKELKCYLPSPKEKEERSTREIRDVLFLPRNERYLIALSGDHMFLWDVVRGELIDRVLLPSALGQNEKASLSYKESGSGPMILVGAESVGLPVYGIQLN